MVRIEVPLIGYEPVNVAILVQTKRGIILTTLESDTYRSVLRQ